MKSLTNKILSDFLICPYKLQINTIDFEIKTNQKLTLESRNKYADISKIIVKSIIEFFKLPSKNRNIVNLENVLRTLWNGNIFSSSEEERQYGLESLELINKFYFNNNIIKEYSLTGLYLKNRILSSEFGFEIQSGEIFKVQKRIEITDYSISKYNKKIIDKSEFFNNFNMLNKINGLFQNFDINEIKYIKNNIRLNIKNEILFNQDDNKKYSELLRNTITEYLNCNEYLRKPGNHCNFCNLALSCQLSKKISYTENTKYFQFLNFLSDLLKTEIKISNIEKFILNNLTQFIPKIKNYSKIIEYDIFIEKYFNHFDRNIFEAKEVLKLDYFVSNNVFIYYFKFSKYNDNKIFLFETEEPLGYEYHININFLLEFIKVKIEQLHFYNLSVIDKLTGLYNHGYYRYISEKEIKRCQEFSKRLGVILFDIDFFKKFNDTFGHQVGDFIIESIASEFKSSIRKLDIAIRYGGEEFIAICPNIIDKEELIKISENIRSKIENKIFIDKNSKEYKVTISGGISVYPDESLEILELVRIADERLYTAKKSGRNKIVFL